MCSIGTDQTIPLETLPLRPDSVLTLVDGDGVIKYSSASVERVLEYDQDELVGEHITERIHPDDRERVTEMLGALSEDRGHKEREAEYRQRKADGTYKRVKSVGASQPTDEGWYIIKTSAVTDRDASAADIEATEEFDTFAKVVSHDLRNPLNVASGHVELLYDDIADQSTEYRQRLRKVMYAHDRMETLIENLLTLARSGGELNSAEWIAFDSLCQRCWQNVSTADAQLVVEFDSEVRADASRLQQLVENLVRNAIEHGGEDVTVAIGKTDDGDGFYVADDGTGIPDDMKGQVFQNGFSTLSDGTGFGLAIVTEIADAHGWEVEVTESRSGGARFDITSVEIR
jgi:PAS domain S-box-containing protein